MSSTAGSQAVKPIVHEVTLSQLLQGKKLKEGANELTKSESGLTLSALVEKGRITGWKVTDADGTEVPHTLTAKAPGEHDRCFIEICISRPHQPGTEYWTIEVDCRIIIIVITPRS
jgi:hypothetical protein